MAEPISIQQLKDASLDAKTLEEAVNGDAVTTVLSRLGETYPTLSNALNQIDSKLDSADAQIKQGITNLFENGGLPAKPFATKALMTASALVDGDYAVVTDDPTLSNNGLYIKEANVWKMSKYDTTKSFETIFTNSELYNGNYYTPLERGAIRTATGEYYPNPETSASSGGVRLVKPIRTYADKPLLAEATDPNQFIAIRYDNEMQRISSTDWISRTEIYHDGYVTFTFRKSEEEPPATPEDIGFVLRDLPPDEDNIEYPIYNSLVHFDRTGELLNNDSWEQGVIMSSGSKSDTEVYDLRARTKKLIPFTGKVQVTIADGWAIRFFVYGKNRNFKQFIGYFDGASEIEVDSYFGITAKYIGVGGNIGIGELPLEASDGIPVSVKPADTRKVLPTFLDYMTGTPVSLPWVRGTISSQPDETGGKDRPLSYSLSRISVRTPFKIPVNSKNNYGFSCSEDMEFLVYKYSEEGEYVGTNGAFVQSVEVIHDGFIRVAARFVGQTPFEDINTIQVFMKVEPNSLGVSSGGAYNPFLFDKFEGVYRAPDVITAVSAGGEKDLAGLTYADIYAEYDALVSAFPDYVTKVHLGDDEAGHALNKYVFAPPLTSMREEAATVKIKNFKIALMSGIHGNEKNSVWSTLEFFKDLCYNERNEHNLNVLKNNVELQIMPIVNPRGWDANVRGNTVIEDLNRDFYALVSEEVKIAKAYIDSNADAITFYDIHNIGGYFTSLYYAASPVSINIANSVFRRMIEEWKGDYNIDIESEKTRPKVLHLVVASSSAGYAKNTVGLRTSMTIEHPLYKVYFDPISHGEITIKTSMEVLADTLFATVEYASANPNLMRGFF